MTTPTHYAEKDVAEVIERCVQICREHEIMYASPEYVSDPLGSFGERFACRQIEAAISRAHLLSHTSPDGAGE